MTMSWLATALPILDRWRADGGGGRILPKWETPPPWLVQISRLRGNLALMEVETPLVLENAQQGPGKIFGANMMFRPQYSTQIGLFDTALGPSGERPVNFEDIDIVGRALKNGRKMAYDPEVVVYHRVPPERMRMSYTSALGLHDGPSRGATRHDWGWKASALRAAVLAVPDNSRALPGVADRRFAPTIDGAGAPVEPLELCRSLLVVPRRRPWRSRDCGTGHRLSSWSSIACWSGGRPSSKRDSLNRLILVSTITWLILRRSFQIGRPSWTPFLGTDPSCLLGAPVLE